MDLRGAYSQTGSLYRPPWYGDYHHSVKSPVSRICSLSVFSIGSGSGPGWLGSSCLTDWGGVTSGWGSSSSSSKNLV